MDDTNYYDIYNKIIMEIKNKERTDIEYFINGVSVQNESIQDICILFEDTSYMQEYIGDTSGKLVKILFDKI